MMYSGRCLCGAVQFTASEVETDHHACHCGMCRRWSGGTPLFATAARDVQFDGVEQPASYDSSEWARRGFCRTCGTVLFYYLKSTETYLMCIGAFDDQTPFRLVREICIDRKPDGYAFAGDHPRWTEQETFARLTPTA